MSISIKPISSILLKALKKYGKQGLIIILCLMAAKVIGLFAQARAAVYLGAESYGISGIFYGLAPFIVLLTNLRTDIVLVREYDHYKRQNLLKQITSSIFSFRLIAFILIAATTIPFIVKNEAYLLCWLMALPFYANQALKPYWLLQAQKKLHVHYLGMLVQTAVTAACIFIFFIPGQSLGSDLIAYSIGGSASLLLTWKLANRGMPHIRIDQKVIEDSKEITFATRWILLTALFSVSYTSLELPLLVALSSPAEAGVYRTAVNLSENLYTFLAFANLLLYPHLIEWHQKGRAHLLKMQSRILLIFGAFGLTLVFIIGALAPIIYQWLYSGAYDDAISHFQKLVLAKVFMLLAGIYSWGLMARKSDKVLLIILAPLSVLSIAASFAFIPTFGSTASANIALAFSASFFLLTLSANYKPER
jgi:O-antigen/teichoic acid export membrane protein